MIIYLKPKQEALYSSTLIDSNDTIIHITARQKANDNSLLYLSLGPFHLAKEAFLQAPLTCEDENSLSYTHSYVHPGS